MHHYEFTREAELGFRAFGLSSDAKALYELTRDCHHHAATLHADLIEARHYLDRLIHDIKEFRNEN
jgi:hypothetical protein